MSADDLLNQGDVRPDAECHVKIGGLHIFHDVVKCMVQLFGLCSVCVYNYDQILNIIQCHTYHILQCNTERSLLHCGMISLSFSVLALKGDLMVLCNFCEQT